MPDLINGRTAEEIKRGILCSNGCCDCSYAGFITEDETCSEYVTRDTIALIAQLEAERDAALAKVPKWISVEKRLPPPQTKRYFVLIKTYEGIPVTQTCVWAWNENDEVGEFIHWEGKIAYWMPLPEPPVEQRDTKEVE